MSEYTYCPDCGEYADLAQHRQNSRIYKARFGAEDEWESTCGEYLRFLEDDHGLGERSAAEAFCKRVDNEDSHRIEDNRTVWVRLQGDEGDGNPYQVEMEMVPQYRATEMKPCPGGCGEPTTLGRLCHACMRDARETGRVAGTKGVGR